jgi:hypothetical protein
VLGQVQSGLESAIGKVIRIRREAHVAETMKERAG